MDETLKPLDLPDVPKQVFEKFLDQLEKEGVSGQLVKRLRKTILEDNNLTDRALKEAILSEDTV